MKAWVTVRRTSQFRNGCNWHTNWRCAKGLLATCFSSRRPESKRTPRFCIRSIWGSASPIQEQKQKNFSIGRPKHSKSSVLLGLSLSSLCPIQNPGLQGWSQGYPQYHSGNPGWKCKAGFFIGILMMPHPKLSGHLTQWPYVDVKLTGRENWALQ